MLLSWEFETLLPRGWWFYFNPNGQKYMARRSPFVPTRWMFWYRADIFLIQYMVYNRAASIYFLYPAVSFYPTGIYTLYPPKVEHGSLSSYRNPIGKDRRIQPPFFRGELWTFGGVYLWYLDPPGSAGCWSRSFAHGAVQCCHGHRGILKWMGGSKWSPQMPPCQEISGVINHDFSLVIP